MSASATVASSTLSRSKTVITILTALATVYGLYYIQDAIFNHGVTTASTPGPGLHRSNAVHGRRRRRSRANEDDGEGGNQRRSNVSTEDDEPVARPIGDGETVVDEQGRDDWSWDGQPPDQRIGQNIVQLLFRVSEDATRRNAYVHRGTLCNSCGTVPIRGIRYRCSNCPDFDLCEACEAQGLHTKTHVFYKIRVPTSYYSTRQPQPVWYPGDPDSWGKSLSKELFNRLSRETGFERPELDAYWEQWTFMANTEWREDPDGIHLAMDRRTFDQCLVPSDGNRHAAPNLIHDRMFAFYDRNNDSLISFPEFVNGLAFRKKKDKLKRVFEAYDLNNDGFVDRKDFLRIFRSYYVLYKNLQRDMLEGLDDQVMNNTEAHHLISGRQPLSSAFGRDGRFPPAPDTRTGEGKQVDQDGDLKIIDGKGIVSDSGNDFGSKEDVIMESVTRNHNQRMESEYWTTDSAYWRAVADPPENVAHLHERVLESLWFVNEANDGPAPIEAIEDGNLSNDHTGEEQSSAGPSNANNNLEVGLEQPDWVPTFVTVADAEAVCGTGVGFDGVPISRRGEVVSFARKRHRVALANDLTVTVHDEIHERWKRRQFYTDEEEGAMQPGDWKEEEDVPQENGKVTESTKDGPSRTSLISPRSRSSSKVRFAEDADDYDTRSNPSTSSRSLPERWGGMEIPEIEKDAGKEILYQVTQQAFNELLDPLFKSQEDRAMAALSSIHVRLQYRSLFTHPHFETWAKEVDKLMIKTKSKQSKITEEMENEMRAWKERPDMPEVELVDVREQPLDRLLAVSGYSVMDSTTARLNGSAVAGNAANINAEQPPGLSHETQLPTNHGEVQYRDPTLPQFRPNSVPQISETASNLLALFNSTTNAQETAAKGPEPRIEVRFESTTPGLGNPDSNEPEGEVQAASSPGTSEFSVVYTQNRGSVGNDNGADMEMTGPVSLPELLSEHILNEGMDGQVDLVLSKMKLKLLKEEILRGLDSRTRVKVREGLKKWDWMSLYKLREMENTWLESKTRGGWGRLSFAEFEELVKGMAVGGRNATMDYLGSWIEYCIP